jgi:tetrahydromethanopterin S-methyltransferase subunit B
MVDQEIEVTLMPDGRIAIESGGGRVFVEASELDELIERIEKVARKFYGIEVSDSGHRVVKDCKFS